MDESPNQKPGPSQQPTWNYWLISRLIWMLLAMVVLVVMFFLFMRIAYH